MKKAFTLGLMMLACGLGYVGGQMVPVALAQVGGTWTPAQMDATLDGISEQLTRYRTLLVQSESNITLADNELAAMVADYGTLVTAINADAAANPDDANKAARKARATEYLAERATLKTQSAAMKAALDAL